MKPPDEFDEKRQLIEWLSGHLEQAALDRVRQMAEHHDFARLVEYVHESRLVRNQDIRAMTEDVLAARCMLATQHAIRKAVSSYTTAGLPVAAWLFKAKEKEPGYDVPASQGWQGIIEGPFHVVAVDGRHTTMMLGPGNLRCLGTAISEAVMSADECE